MSTNKFDLEFVTMLQLLTPCVNTFNKTSTSCSNGAQTASEIIEFASARRTSY